MKTGLLVRLTVAALAVLGTQIVGGCVSTEYTQTQQDASTATPIAGVQGVAVIVESTPYSNQFGQIAQTEVEAAMKSRGFRVMNQKAIKDALEHFKLQESDLTTTTGRAQIGEFMNVQAFVYVAVTEASNFQETGTWPFRIDPPIPSVSASISIKLTSQGQVENLWVDTIRKKSQGSDLSRHVQITADQLMRERFPYRAGPAAG